MPNRQCLDKICICNCRTAATVPLPARIRVNRIGRHDGARVPPKFSLHPLRCSGLGLEGPKRDGGVAKEVGRVCHDLSNRLVPTHPSDTACSPAPSPMPLARAQGVMLVRLPTVTYTTPHALHAIAVARACLHSFLRSPRAEAANSALWVARLDRPEGTHECVRGGGGATRRLTLLCNRGSVVAAPLDTLGVEAGVELPASMSTEARVAAVTRGRGLRWLGHLEFICPSGL